MTPGTDPAADPDGLSFEGEARAARAQARSRYWRGVWGLALVVLATCLVLTVAFNALYRLAVARTLHWPSSLVPATVEFQEGDPLLQAFANRQGCSDDHITESWDDHAELDCQLLTAMVSGDLAAASALLADVAGGPDTGLALPNLKAALDTQLQDAASRQDWATCSAAAWLALQVLDKEDSPPQASAADDNRLLLLAAACEQAGTALRAPEAHTQLLATIARGAHLEADFPATWATAPARTSMRAWGEYLSGLSRLRARDFDAADRHFVGCFEQGPPGALRELALLGMARSVFWRQTTLGFAQGAAASASAPAAVKKLRSLAQGITRASFRSDVEQYLAALAP